MQLSQIFISGMIWIYLKKKEVISKFLENFSNIDELVVYFDKYLIDLSKKTLNSYLKSVINQ